MSPCCSDSVFLRASMHDRTYENTVRTVGEHLEFFHTFRDKSTTNYTIALHYHVDMLVLWHFLGYDRRQFLNICK